MDGGAQQPPKARKGYGVAATDPIGYRACHYGADDGTAGQSGTDATLSGSRWIVEIIDVLLRSDDGGDGGDVEAKAGDGYMSKDDCSELGIAEHVNGTYSMPPTVAMVARK